METPVQSFKVKNHQLLKFNMKTKKLLEAIEIPQNIAVNSTTGKSLLITPILNTFGRNCEDTIVYIADVEGYAILVYNSKTATWCRVISKDLVYDPSAQVYTIAGQSFSLVDGPLGMALSPTKKKLYLSPMSSYNIVSVKTSQLYRAQNVDDSVLFEVHKDVLTTQSSAKAMSRGGTLFMGLVNSTSIACWHESKPLTKENIVIIAKDPVNLQFTSGMKIKSEWTLNGRTDVILAFTNRYQKIATGTMNFNEINFRILKGNVNDLIKGTVCQPRRRRHSWWSENM